MKVHAFHSYVINIDCWWGIHKCTSLRIHINFNHVNLDIDISHHKLKSIIKRLNIQNILSYRLVSCKPTLLFHVPLSWAADFPGEEVSSADGNVGLIAAHHDLLAASYYLAV